MSLTALQLANQRLQAIRKQQGVKVACVRVDPTVTPPPNKPKIMAINETMAELPPHLGYGSAPLADHLRRIVPDVFEASSTAVEPQPLADIAKNDDTAVTPPNKLKIQPALAFHAIAKHAPLVRLYFIMKLTDNDRAGWLKLSELKSQTENLFTWRRVRQILNAGNGIWWTIEADRIFYRGQHHIANELGIEKLSGRPTYLSADVLLTDSLARFKAEIYAIWHSSRKTTNPISQDTIQEKYDVSGRTQRRYCNLAGITRKANYAIGEQNNSGKAEYLYQEHGLPAFTFTDVRGQNGRRGATYVAWRLPNSYSCERETTSRSSQRRANRKLSDLKCKMVRGTDSKPQRVFYEDGATASKRYNRRKDDHTIYWKEKTRHMRSRHHEIWFALSPIA